MTDKDKRRAHKGHDHPTTKVERAKCRSRKRKGYNWFREQATEQLLALLAMPADVANYELAEQFIENVVNYGRSKSGH